MIHAPPRSNQASLFSFSSISSHPSGNSSDSIVSKKCQVHSPVIHMVFDPAVGLSPSALASGQFLVQSGNASTGANWSSAAPSVNHAGADGPLAQMDHVICSSPLPQTPGTPYLAPRIAASHPFSRTLRGSDPRRYETFAVHPESRTLPTKASLLLLRQSLSGAFQVFQISEIGILPPDVDFIRHVSPITRSSP